MIPGSHRLAGASLALALCLMGGAHAASAEAPVKDTSRIVSIGGDVTEILYALNAAPKIVAVDTTSTYQRARLRRRRALGTCVRFPRKACSP
jgi:ABC-type hemin transport system substrate-binding protein